MSICFPSQVYFIFGAAFSLLLVDRVSKTPKTVVGARSVGVARDTRGDKVAATGISIHRIPVPKLTHATAQLTNRFNAARFERVMRDDHFTAWVIVDK